MIGMHSKSVNSLHLDASEPKADILERILSHRGQLVAFNTTMISVRDAEIIAS